MSDLLFKKGDIVMLDETKIDSGYQYNYMSRMGHLNCCFTVKKDSFVADDNLCLEERVNYHAKRFKLAPHVYTEIYQALLEANLEE